MTMEREGPPLERLLHRLAETPAEFLDEPRLGRRGRVDVGAVAGDLVRLLGGAPTTVAAPLVALGPGGAGDRNALAVALVLAWLLADEAFHGTPPATLTGLLTDAARELAAQTASRQFVEHAERREELARLALARCGARPAGETVAQAQDRLTALSAAERRRVMAAARVAEERARAIREALVRKAAEESADKWSRE